MARHQRTLQPIFGTLRLLVRDPPSRNFSPALANPLPDWTDTISELRSSSLKPRELVHTTSTTIVGFAGRGGSGRLHAVPACSSFQAHSLSSSSHPGSRLKGEESSEGEGGVKVGGDAANEPPSSGASSESPSSSAEGHVAKSDFMIRLQAATQTAAKTVFFFSLKAQITEVSSTADMAMIEQLLEEKFEALWAKYKHKAKGISIGPVTSACLVVTAHQVAGPWLNRDPDAFRKILEALLGGTSSGAFGFVHRFSMMMKRNKLAFVGELMDKTKADWGPAFTAQRLSEEGREEVTVSQCCYFDILNAEGVPELVPLFCKLERAWFDSLKLSNQGIQFSVPSRIADGDSVCSFVAKK